MRKFGGTHIPGSRLFQTSRKGLLFNIQSFETNNFEITLRTISANSPVDLQVNEQRKGIRIETVLSGELIMKLAGGKKVHLLPGQYHLVEQNHYRCMADEGIGCVYISFNLSSSYISQLGLPVKTNPVNARPLSGAMQDLIFELLKNHYDLSLLPYYYETMLRAILFEHHSAPEVTFPGELTSRQIAAMYELDEYMAANLDSDLTMKTLTKIAGTNAYFLKKAYFQVFGERIFTRLIQRRMERAKHLLETTDRPLKDIFQLTGYRSLAGFIT